MVEWLSALAEYPDEVLPEHYEAFAALIELRHGLLHAGFLKMISQGHFPSKGWWIEERIRVVQGTLVYSQRHMEPPAIETLKSC